MRIALDAMGGDFAPQATVEGAYLYQKETKRRNEVVLVCDEEKIRQELSSYKEIKESGISIVHTSQNIGMNESPTDALKQKKESSIMIGLKLHKKGEVDAFVSAGNTGAQMAASRHSRITVREGCFCSKTLMLLRALISSIISIVLLLSRYVNSPHRRKDIKLGLASWPVSPLAGLVMNV